MFSEKDCLIATLKTLSGKTFSARIMGATSLKDVYNRMSHFVGETQGLLTLILRNPSKGITTQYRLMNL